MSRVAVVTGAAAGIGAAVTACLTEAGYAVAAWDRFPGGIEVDVGDPESVRAALDTTRATLGTPTAVVTAAGVMTVRPFLELDPNTWSETLRVNLTGTFLVLRACAAAMVEEGLFGSMVAIASVAARGPRQDAADYAASKAGVVSVAQSAADALAPHGIRVNAVCPGVVDTPMTRRNAQARAEREHLDTEEVLSTLVSRVPLGRAASPVEIATVARRLLGSDFGYVTGQALNVCGGLEFD